MSESLSIFKPTVQDIKSDKITKLSVEYWNESNNAKKPFNPNLIVEIYNELDYSKIMLLELNRYLELYLWPNFDPSTSSRVHLISIMIMVNAKFRENVKCWESFQTRDKEVFKQFFNKVLLLGVDKENPLSIKEKEILLQFLLNCFQSLEDDLINSLILRLTLIPSWVHLSEKKRTNLFTTYPLLYKRWQRFQQEERKAENRMELDEQPNKKLKSDGESLDITQPSALTYQFEKNFIWDLIQEFISLLSSIKVGSSSEPNFNEKILYCERFLEFVRDLLSQLPTRRYFKPLLESSLFIPVCRLSYLRNAPEGRIFSQQLKKVVFYYFFEIDDFNGVALTNDEVLERHYEKIQTLQLIAFKHFSAQLKPLALCNVGAIEKKKSLRNVLSVLDDEGIKNLAIYLSILSESEELPYVSRELLLESILLLESKRKPQIDIISELPIYPTETMWDTNALLSSTLQYSSLLHSLGLPKLNLQFLTYNDYLLRNFELFLLEASYEIKEDIEDCIKRIAPRRNDIGRTEMTGWARMALPIKQFKIFLVGQPNVGERAPSKVQAEVTVNLATLKPEIRAEWEAIKMHDILFLVFIQSPTKKGENPNLSLPFDKAFGIKAVRGCEVYEVADGTGKVIESQETKFFAAPEKDEDEEANPADKLRASRKIQLSNERIFRLKLDVNQYFIDSANFDEEDIYSTYTSSTVAPSIGFNLLIRRKPKENNFKAVLESIRALMKSNTESLVPKWFYEAFLGYGDPSTATANNLLQNISGEVDFLDTFIDFNHVKESFPDVDIQLEGVKDGVAPSPPFKLRFEDNGKKVIVRPYTLPNQGPYPQDAIKLNQIRFTPVQLQAVMSGVLHEGLTLVVGPPGTGKTDVAVQIINLLYHNNPNQRTLLITHSNQALNQLFEKIIELNVDQRHLLRLGHGEKSLDVNNTKKDFKFNRVGRVDFMLARRLELLEEVTRLGKSLFIDDDVGYTCETAWFFYSTTIVNLWEEFLKSLEKDDLIDAVSSHFPLNKFFENAPQLPLFSNNNRAEDIEIAKGCFRHIEKIFVELKEVRPFELLRSSYDRTTYLLIKQAKIIAMTCTHAALKKEDFIKSGFKFDNIVVEEAGQILDIEAFIPMMCRHQFSHGDSPLRRAVLIGDHNQLPPVVKNVTLQRYSHLDQSLFTRLVRLGTPFIELDRQGRARPSIAELYRYRYKNLKDLTPVFDKDPFYARANAGFLYDYQLINVEDYNGRGELEPVPHFYQNLGEAEYIVALYQYMRLLGYPAEKISIITTYNGQKCLIRDVINQRCAHSMFGRPHKITTVDRFQGQQNDYILFSMVRTKTVGHIRDLRRLVVAMSRARLGLYVFCRRSLFENCYELSQTFSLLTKRPDTLRIVENEAFPAQRELGNVNVKSKDIENLSALLNHTKNIK